eukprot:scaffold5163_cov296-Prasinococcus_capsulatus_cf.AAC.2
MQLPVGLLLLLQGRLQSLDLYGGRSTCSMGDLSLDLLQLVPENPGCSHLLLARRSQLVV